jgi:hypothetical protein
MVRGTSIPEIDQRINQGSIAKIRVARLTYLRSSKMSLERELNRIKEPHIKIIPITFAFKIKFFEKKLVKDKRRIHRGLVVP